MAHLVIVSGFCALLAGCVQAQPMAVSDTPVPNPLLQRAQKRPEEKPAAAPSDERKVEIERKLRELNATIREAQDKLFDQQMQQRAHTK